ncbi:MAG: hypothetical protein ACRDT4_18695 [Micromonosporaceae bacterium]
MACYTYDANGRLTQTWDPRPSGASCGTPVLATSYGYDTTSGRLTSLTPPGLQPWILAYDASGRLSTVSRSHADGSGTETTTLQYGAPIGSTSTDANPDLSPARIAAWGQRVAPVTAVAVFEPGDDTAELRDGEIHALDPSGREINTAAFSGTGQSGWKVDTVEYDRFGNTVRELSARNRDLALTADPVTLGMPAGSTTIDLARALDETTIYSADGVDQTDSYGPYHSIAIDGGWTHARAHTRTSYGQLEEPGADPTINGPKHTVIEQTVAASQSVTASPVNETDARTTRNRYALSATDVTGWTFRTPMAVTIEMGAAPDIVTETRYHSLTGQVIEVRQPSAAGISASPGTTKTSYYTTGAHNPGVCTSSAWYGLACKTEPGAQPAIAGLPQLPITTYTYDGHLRPTVVTETVVDAAGTTRTRTTTTTYENAGNGPRVVRVETTGGLGTAVPATTTSYHPTTGLPTATATETTPAVQITTGYDDFGRARTTTDADGGTTDTSYHPNSGDIASITWKDATSATLGSQTYGYDGGTEHRGLTTSITDTGLGGAITATYDADETLTTQTMPNGITATYTTDPTGDTTKISYAKSGSFWFDDRQDSNIHGQQRWHIGPNGTDAYAYDPAGRLTAVWDQRNGQGCIQRGYTLDPDSNRAALTTWPANPQGTCPPGATTPTTTSYSHDAADRLQPTGTAAGLTYDAYGRITTLPAALAGGTTTTIGYHTTDMVATQTQGATTRTWTLDPAGRLRAASITGAPTTTNHYDGTGDSPAWIDEGDTTRTRYLTGLDGTLTAAITTNGTTTVRYQLTGLRRHHHHQPRSRNTRRRLPRPRRIRQRPRRHPREPIRLARR